MKIKNISVEKYRSITTAKKINLDKMTILVGPNNEGKSNILRALVMAMTVLTRGKTVLRKGSRRTIKFHREGYSWELDFPVHLQEKHPNGKSIIILEFELSKDDINEFQKEIKSKITGFLPLKISIGKDKVDITYHKRGSGSATLSKKSNLIANFISERIDFDHIQAVRTSDSAERIVDHMVARELSILEKNEEYISALNKIEELQSPILDELSLSIQNTLKKFLPKIKEVSIRIDTSDRYRAVRQSSRIIVNDGEPTLLSYKGDGVQSLAALGIIRHYSDKISTGKSFVIAIEEPESHLHPSAIHELKAVIDELSNKHQILITTHNPLFVDRRIIKNNVIVNNHRAWPAKNIGEIRKVLGVRTADNLRHAELVLIVEGEDDRLALSAILRTVSQYLNKAFKKGLIAIDTLCGASNLSYKITLIRDNICLYHVFLDYDKAGKDAVGKAKFRRLIKDTEVNFCIHRGLKESELEDLYDKGLVENIISSKYGISLSSSKAKSKKKWSERIKECFLKNGKNWDSNVESELKLHIAKAVAASPQAAIKKSQISIIESLARSLENRLKEKEQVQKDVVDS